MFHVPILNVVNGCRSWFCAVVSIDTSVDKGAEDEIARVVNLALAGELVALLVVIFRVGAVAAASGEAKVKARVC